MFSPRRSALPLLPLQLALAGTLAGVLALVPPAEGKMMLVPLAPGPARQLVADAVARGGRLVAMGPLPGSVIVAGHRGAFASMIRHGVLVLAAPAAGCGGETAARA